MKNTPLPDISGNWKGHDEQLSFGRPAMSKITCTFEKVSQGFEGEISFFFGALDESIYLPKELRPFSGKIRAGWFKEKVLKLDWFNHEVDFIFCGSAYFELMHNGDKLAGHFVGYGPHSHALVQGPIMLARE